MTAVLGASADRLPMLLLTPQAPLSRQGRGAFQDSSPDAVDLVGMLSKCTRYSTAITHPTQVPYRLARAMQAAQSAPFGPVHLSIPSDILAGQADPSSPSVGAPQLPMSTPIDEFAAADLVDQVLKAEFPVFYVGDDAGLSAPRLCNLASALGCVVVSSPAGKRWLSHRERCYLGVTGFAGHPRAMAALRKADLVVTFGATFDEFSTNAWSIFKDARVIAVDRHATFTCRMPNATVVIAETSQIVERIQNALPIHCGNRRALSSFPPPTLVGRSREGTIHPLELMRWLNQKLPDNVVVHIDTGSSMAWATRDLSRNVPDTYRVAMGACSMCWAISAAIGAAVAKRERVICVTGDGAMLMSSLELTVAVEHNLPITYVVLNDSSLGMVRHGQRLAGAEAIATQITPVRFELLAQACGMEARRVACGAELERIPSAWLGDREGGPRLIDVNIDPEAVPPIGQRIAALNVEPVTP